MKVYKMAWSFFCSALVCCGQVGDVVPDQVNVLFIAVDDLRPELGCYGVQHIESPNIDRLANTGAVFVNSYCNVPVCGASRASLLTGLRPTHDRFKSYLTRADEDAPEVRTLPGVFRDHGYRTISNGKVFHGASDSKEDWTEIWRPRGVSPRDYCSPENIRLDTSGSERGWPYENANVPDTAYKDGKVAQKTKNDLIRLSKNQEPFFLAAGFYKPHLPFNAPEKYWDLYDRKEIRLPQHSSQPMDVPGKALHNFGELRHYTGVPGEGPVSDSLAKTLIHGYYACVSYTDTQIGKILHALDSLGLDRNTVVVLWGDHGFNLLEHGLWCKHSNFRTSLKAPLIIRDPRVRQPHKINAMTEFVDIYPTLVDLCAIAKPEHLEGASLVPWIQGKEVEGWKGQVESVWHNGFTYTSFSHAYTEWRTEQDSVLAQMLFDHLADPDETKNIATDPHSDTIIARIRETYLFPQ